MLHEAKQRYAIRRDAARRHAATTLSAAFGLDFHLSGWTNKAQQAYGLQWGAAERHPDGNWDWFEIFGTMRLIEWTW